MSVPPIWECVLRLFLSALFGGAVGLEREYRLKEAGIRTHLIVSFASCLMMLVSKYGFFDILVHQSISLDPSRIAASIVTGIGFLGAGTIFARGRNITGLTTAAGLWATLGIGMSMGAGMYFISTFAAVFILVIQAILHRELAFLNHTGTVLYIRLTDQPGALEWLHETLAGLGLASSGSKYEREDGFLSVELEIDRLPCSVKELGELLQPVAQSPNVKSIQW